MSLDHMPRSRTLERFVAVVDWLLATYFLENQVTQGATISQTRKVAADRLSNALPSSLEGRLANCSLHRDYKYLPIPTFIHLLHPLLLYLTLTYHLLLHTVHEDI